MLRTSLLLAICAVGGCSDDRSDVYTLYRASALDQHMRIHVASFDAANSGVGFNQENCLIAAGLFAAQPGVTVRYWCEKGSFKR